jgi:hypothetical protein
MTTHEVERRQGWARIPLYALLLISQGYLSFVASGSPRGPVAVPPPTDVFLGEGPPGEPLVKTLFVGNKGDAPLVIRGMQVGCSCTGVEPPPPFELAPGSVRDIRVGVRLEAEFQERQTWVTLFTNDPRRPEIGVHLLARADTIVRLEPMTVSFPPTTSAESAEATVRIYAPDGRAWDSGRPIRINHGSRWLEVRQTRDRLGHLVCQVTLKPGAPFGPLRDVLELSPAGGERTVTVPVSAHVRDTFLIVPSPIVLRPATGAGDGGQASVLVKRSDGKSLGRFLAADAPAGVAVVEARRTASLAESTLRMFQVTCEKKEASYPPKSVLVRLRFANAPDAVLTVVPSDG